MLRLCETIGWLLYQLSRTRFWKRPKLMVWPYFSACGYGRFNYNTGSYQFPVRCLEEEP